MKKLCLHKNGYVVDQFDIFNIIDDRGDGFVNAVPSLKNIEALEQRGPCLFAIVDGEPWGTCRLVKHDLHFI